MSSSPLIAGWTSSCASTGDESRLPLVWTITEVLVIVAILGFTVASWAVFKLFTWWEPVALISAVVGLLAVLPYVLGIHSLDGFGDAGVLMNIGVLMNVAIHSLGSAVVVLPVIVPFVHEWLTRWI